MAGAKVSVNSDGLDMEARESRYNFQVINQVPKNEMQIESIGALSSSRDAVKIMRLVGERVSISNVYSLEDLHLRIGSACAKFEEIEGRSTPCRIELSLDRNENVRITISENR